MKEDKDLTTKIEIESRIATRLIHISNAVELDECEHKQYILDEIKAISALVSRGLFKL